MNTESRTDEVLAVKDEGRERPIPTSWRPTFEAIVARYAAGDYALDQRIPNVEPVSPEIAAQVRDYVQDYGATLVPLPDATWDSSVCLWMGERWDAFVDLWTREEGRSDLVLHARVAETELGTSFMIHLVYVP